MLPEFEVFRDTLKITLLHNFGLPIRARRFYIILVKNVFTLQDAFYKLLFLTPTTLPHASPLGKNIF